MGEGRRGGRGRRGERDKEEGEREKSPTRTPLSLSFPPVSPSPLSLLPPETGGGARHPSARLTRAKRRGGCPDAYLSPSYTSLPRIFGRLGGRLGGAAAQTHAAAAMYKIIKMYCINTAAIYKIIKCVMIIYVYYDHTAHRARCWHVQSERRLSDASDTRPGNMYI